MITLDDLVKRYPKMADVIPERFEIFVEDSQVIMGKDESRWLGWYNQAQAALIAHLVTINNSLEADDLAMPSGPVSRTDVEDVQVEFSRLWDKVPFQEAMIYSTAYGQMYAMYRRMAFAGPRIA